MSNIILKKTIVIITIVIVISNMILLPFGLVDPLIFWLIIIISGIMAYKIFPRMK